MPMKAGARRKVCGHSSKLLPYAHVSWLDNGVAAVGNGKNKNDSANVRANTNLGRAIVVWHIYYLLFLAGLFRNSEIQKDLS
jgi:hypothetical protein